MSCQRDNDKRLTFRADGETRRGREGNFEWPFYRKNTEQKGDALSARAFSTLSTLHWSLGLYKKQRKKECNVQIKTDKTMSNSVMKHKRGHEEPLPTFL